MMNIFTYPFFVLPNCHPFFCLQLTDKDVYLSYLPLAHIFDRVIEEAMIMHGASIGFWRGVSICQIFHHWMKAWYDCWALGLTLCWEKSNFALDNMLTQFVQWLQDVKLLIEDIGELKPTIFVAVPRVLDRVYNGKFVLLLTI